MPVSEKQIRKINGGCFILKENWWFNSNYHNVHKNILILSYQVCSRCCGLHSAENHRGLWGHVFRGTQEKRPRRILGYYSELSRHWPRYMYDDDTDFDTDSQKFDKYTIKHNFVYFVVSNHNSNNTNHNLINSATDNGCDDYNTTQQNWWEIFVDSQKMLVRYSCPWF